MGNDYCSSSATHQDAMDQLVEENMGSELSASAMEIVGLPRGSIHRTVDRLTDSSSFQALQDVVEKCYAKKLDASNKRPNDAPDQPKVTTTSFSLFDILDQQKAAFTLPPRITAAQVIDAHQREKRDVCGQTNNSDLTNGYQSSLDLLEKAENIEDLSPDPETWEQVRQILYNGLVTSARCIEIRSRYFQVHKSLFDISRRGSERGNNKTQSWDLLQNLIGAILILSDDILKAVCGGGFNIPSTKECMNLYWDLIQHLIASLSYFALDYITACVGDEQQIERMLVGMCLILAHDCATIVTAAIDPLAGWFEVWGRFIPPKRMVAIIQFSGLGGSVLRKYRRSVTSNFARKLIDELNRCGCKEFITFADVESAIHLQNLSTLRLILYQCGSSQLAVAMLFQQSTNYAKLSREKECHLSSFLTLNGVVCTNIMQRILDELQIHVECLLTQGISEFSKAVDTVFEPFLGVLSSNDPLTPNEMHLLPHIEWVCKSSLEIYDQLKYLDQ